MDQVSSFEEEPAGSSLDLPAEQVIPVYAEQVSVQTLKKAVSALRITKSVETRDQYLQLTTTQSGVGVERVPLNSQADQLFDVIPAVRQEGETTIYPVVEEVLVVVKKYRVKEEVRVTRHDITESRSEVVALRFDKIEVQREPALPDHIEQSNSAPLSLAPFTAGVLHLFETHEEPIVMKSARVVEEIHLRKSIAEHTETVRETVRSTEIEIEPISGDSPQTKIDSLDSTA